MARTRFFDYQTPDSTKLLNEWKRGILKAGVYKGFNSSVGSSGFYVSLNMDADPDNTGLLLGTIITHDGVVVQENSNLIDIAQCETPDPTHDRIDLLVATYAYNAGIPNNDVEYEIIKGTASANTAVPSLTDDQIALAEIKVRAASSSLNSSDVVDVNRVDLYSSASSNIEDLLTPGVYSGVNLSRLSDYLVYTSGIILTQENKRLEVSNGQIALNPTSDNNHYRFDYVICAHRYEDIEEQDYAIIVVEGIEADYSLGQTAEIPNDADLLTGAFNYDPKYNDSKYINKLGYIRVQGTSPLDLEFVSTPRLLNNRSFYVSSGLSDDLGYYEDSFAQKWPWIGHEGLFSAIDTIKDIITNFYNQTSWQSQQESKDKLFVDDTPVKLTLSGNFRIPPGMTLAIPSYTEVVGINNSAIRIEASSNYSMLLGGFVSNTGDTSDYAIARAGDGVSQSHVPPGYERIEIAINSGAQGDYAGINAFNNSFNFAGLRSDRVEPLSVNGDEVILTDGSSSYHGVYDRDTTHVVSGDIGWTFSALVPSSTPVISPDGIIIKKKRNGIYNLNIHQIEASGNQSALSFTASIDSTVSNVRVPSVEEGCNTRCKFINLSSERYSWMTRQSVNHPSKYNTYYNLSISCTGSAVIPLGGTTLSLEEGARISSIRINPNGNSVTTYFRYKNSSIDNLFIDSSSDANPVRVNLTESFIDLIVANNDVRIESISSTFGLIVSSDGIYLDSQANNNSIGGYKANNLVDNSTERNNYISRDTLSQVDEDRNLQVESEGSVAWDLTSSQLSWSDDLYIDLGYSTGRNKVLSSDSPAILNNHDRLVVSLDRTAAADTTVSISVEQKANARDIRNADKLIIARRFNNDIFLWNGIKLEDGFSIDVGGSGAPPDNSITRAKMTDSAWDFVKTFARDFFETSPVEDFKNEVVFINTGLVGFTYDNLTGVIQYASEVDLSNVKPGDTFLQRGTWQNPIRGFTGKGELVDRHRIESVDDTNNRLTIGKQVGCLSAMCSIGFDSTGQHDGETLTFDDGVNPPAVFEVDLDSTVTPGNIALDFSSNPTAEERARILRDTVNAYSPLEFKLSILPYDGTMGGTQHTYLQVVATRPGSAAENLIASTLAGFTTDTPRYGLAFDTTVAKAWDGAIVRGNIVVRNTSLLPYSYDKSTGIVTFDSSYDLSAVTKGYLFRDSSANLFKIFDADDSASTVTLEEGLAIDDSAPSNELCGSIEIDNNPRDLKLNDAMTPYGLYELTWTGISKSYNKKLKGFSREDSIAEWEDSKVAFIRANGSIDETGHFSSSQLGCEPEGGAFGDVISGLSSYDIPPINRTSKFQRSNPAEDTDRGAWVEVTAYMTGILLGSFEIDESTEPMHIELDGRVLKHIEDTFDDYDFQVMQKGFSYGVTAPNRPQSALASVADLIRLPPGVHTIRFGNLSNQINDTSLNPARFIILNQPLNDYTVTSDVPGRAWINAKAIDLAESVGVSFPALSGRGSRLIRYVDSEGNRAWSVSNLRSFSTTGVANNSSVLNSVADTGFLSKGDIISVSNGIISENHVIASIGSGTITCLSVISFTSPVSIDYAGMTYLKDDHNALLANEEIDQGYTIGDFQESALTSWNYDGIPSYAYSSLVSVNSQEVCSEGWDGYSYLKGNYLSIIQNDTSLRNGAIVLDSLSPNYLVIGFVGSGIDLLVSYPFLINKMYIDGAYAEGMIIGTDVSSYNRVRTWFRVASELNYGFHVLKIEPDQTPSQLADIIFGYRTYRPKDGEFDGVPISAVTSLSEFNLTSTNNDILVPSKGVIQRYPGNLIQIDGLSPGDYGIFQDLDIDRRRSTWSIAGDVMYVWFWGKRISIIYNVNTASSEYSTVRVLDNDNVFKGPESCIGVNVAGPGSFDIGTVSDFNRQTFEFDYVGLHCVCIDNPFYQGGDPNLSIIAIESDQPFHSSSRIAYGSNWAGRSKLMTSFEDKRLIKAIKRGAARAGMINFKAQLNLGIFNSDVYAVFNFPLSSRGSWFSLNFRFDFKSTNDKDHFITAKVIPAAAINRNSTPISSYTRSSRVTQAEIDYRVNIYVPRGFHVIKLVVSTDKLNKIVMTGPVLFWNELLTTQEDDYAEAGEAPIPWRSI